MMCTAIHLHRSATELATLANECALFRNCSFSAWLKGTRTTGSTPPRPSTTGGDRETSSSMLYAPSATTNTGSTRYSPYMVASGGEARGDSRQDIHGVGNDEQQRGGGERDEERDDRRKDAGVAENEVKARLSRVLPCSGSDDDDVRVLTAVGGGGKGWTRA